MVPWHHHWIWPRTKVIINAILFEDTGRALCCNHICPSHVTFADPSCTSAIFESTVEDVAWSKQQPIPDTAADHLAPDLPTLIWAKPNITSPDLLLQKTIKTCPATNWGNIKYTTPRYLDDGKITHWTAWQQTWAVYPILSSTITCDFQCWMLFSAILFAIPTHRFILDI